MWEVGAGAALGKGEGLRCLPGNSGGEPREGGLGARSCRGVGTTVCLGCVQSSVLCKAYPCGEAVAVCEDPALLRPVWAPPAAPGQRMWGCSPLAAMQWPRAACAARAGLAVPVVREGSRVGTWGISQLCLRPGTRLWSLNTMWPENWVRWCVFAPFTGCSRREVVERCPQGVCSLRGVPCSRGGFMERQGGIFPSWRMSWNFWRKRTQIFTSVSPA